MELSKTKLDSVSVIHDVLNPPVWALVGNSLWESLKEITEETKEENEGKRQKNAIQSY